MSAFEENRVQLYEELNAIVEKLLDTASADDDIRYMCSGYVLLLAYDYLDEDGDIVGDVAVYPKNGSQPSWKGLGMMHRAIEREKEAKG